MFVPSEVDTAGYIRHLEALGYTILEVSPPFAGYEASPSTNQGYPNVAV